MIARDYKVYIAVLAERIRKDSERKKAIPHNQARFKKGIGTINNVYVLNYLVNRQLEKEKKATAMFMDLRTTFDAVDRSVLVE